MHVPTKTHNQFTNEIQFYLNFTGLFSLIISKCLEKILKQRANNIFPTLTRLLHSP